MIGVGFKLFADSTALEKGLSNAEKGIEQTDKVAKKLGVSFAGWKVASEFLQMGLERATALREESEKMGKPVELSVASVASLADGFKRAKEFVSDLAVSTLYWFTSFGEGVGSTINELRGISKTEQAMNEASEEAMKKTLDRIAEARKGFAEKLQKANDDLKKSEEDLFAASATSGQKLAAAITEVVSIEEKLRDVGRDSLRGVELRIELNKALADQAKAKLDFDKESKAAQDEYNKAIEAHQKTVEEMDKEEADAAKSLMLSNEQMLELVALQQKKAQGLNEDEAKRLSILENQVRVKKIEVEVSDILADGEVTTEEQRRLSVLYQQKAQIEAQIEAQRGLTQEVEETVEAEEERTDEIRSQLTLVGKYNEDMSDLALKAKAKELKSDIFNRELAEQSAGASVGGAYYDPLLSFQKNQLSGVEKELADRKKVSSLLSRYGTDMAYTFFGGSASEFERLAQLVSNDPEDSKNLSKLANATDDINERLRKAGFAK